MKDLISSLIAFSFRQCLRCLSYTPAWTSHWRVSTAVVAFLRASSHDFANFSSHDFAKRLTSRWCSSTASLPRIFCCWFCLNCSFCLSRVEYLTCGKISDISFSRALLPFP